MATFLDISRLVTGFSDLGEALARDYSKIIISKPSWQAEFDALSIAVDAALSTPHPETALKQAMAQAPTVKAAARRLAHLWYAGRLPAENGADAKFDSEAAYFGGLLWRAARAHPPGLSGGYTGHWRYAPDA
jgi:hypothetical protein